jgi:CRISPR-associated endonuclease/helicase Cas3
MTAASSPEEALSAWFAALTGHRPYHYQHELARAERPPSVLNVPTGCGKTQAIIGAWLYQRREQRAPRRLVYALPMRSLVDQTADVARDMIDRLEPAERPKVHVLMGGQEQPTSDWRLAPETGQILIGTIDMLLSRALNRGYAESRYAWPVSFGLLNADCRWIFDEVQLMGPARATSAQLDGLRARLGTAMPCETMWASATVDEPALVTVDRPELGTILALGDSDRTGSLAARLAATKVAERVDVSGESVSNLPKLVARLGAERHVPGTRTLIVLNTVAEAQKTYDELGKASRGDGPRAVLLHSRFRPGDRQRHMESAFGELTGSGTIVVSTQVIEAGVDLSSKTLITAIAPFSSIVQRVGRCNREGNEDPARVLWLDQGSLGEGASAHKAAAPYSPADLDRARTTLLELEGTSLAPSRLEAVHVPESRQTPAILRRRDLIDLFDTAPDLSGSDIDIAPFIRSDDERTAVIFFRDLDGKSPSSQDPIPAPAELVQIPRTELTKRRHWIPDFVDGSWTLETSRPPPPGSTVMLDAAEGGYDSEIGWLVSQKGHVEAIEPVVRVEVEGQASDNFGSRPEELQVHLRAVTDEAIALADALGLGSWRDEIAAAAALHDLGKAHGTFQELMHRVVDLKGRPNGDHLLYAKSGTTGGRYNRRHFRHELASALAVAPLLASLEVPSPDLTRFLVGAHHGRVRLAIRPAPGEEPPDAAGHGGRFALGIVDGDRLPAVETPLGRTSEVILDLSAMELGADDSWTDRAAALRDDPELGPFRLALLEAVVRVADWRASRA